MKILVVKLTSMGDVLHLLPALTDLQTQLPEARVDWMVEDNFSDIPVWHSSVERVIPVSTRRWRSLTTRNMREFLAFFKHLRATSYDVVIDAQGLMKSAVLARLARLIRGGKRIGFSADSIKEKPAARLYGTPITIGSQQHAIDRLRQLFSKGLGYPLPDNKPDYAIQLKTAAFSEMRSNTILFLPNTTWASKHLPDQYWRELLNLVINNGYQVKISWGSPAEKTRAEWIAQKRQNVAVMPKSSLNELACLIRNSIGVIAVDTGLGHMAASLGVPVVSVYGATGAKLTGTVGESQIHLQCQYPCSPCFLKQCNKLTDQQIEPPCYQTLSAADIWQALYQKIA